MSLRNEAISGIKWNTIRNVVVVLVKVLQVAVLTRFLSAEDFGLVGIALLFNSFSMILVDMGFGTVVMHEQDLSKEKFASLYWANIGLGLLIAIVISASSPLIAAIYHREELKGVIAITAIMIFTNSISSLQQMIQQKSLNFKFIAIISIASAIITMGLNVYFAMNRWGVYSLVWSSLIGSILIALVYIYIGLFHEKNIILHFKLDEIKQALKIGSFQIGSSILEFFAREMDSIIISAGLPLSFFGAYTLCKNIGSNIYNFVNPIVTGVLTPVFSKIQTQAERIKSTYIETLDLLGGANFFIYGLVASASVPILGVLYGDSYTEYGLVLICLCMYYAQQSMGNPIGSLIIAKGRTDLAFYWSIFRILFVGLYLFLFSHFFNTTVFVIMFAALPLFLQYPSFKISMSRLLDISFPEFFWVVEKPLLCCLPLLTLTIVSSIIKNYIISGVVICVLFALFYFLIYLLFRKTIMLKLFDYSLSMIRRKQTTKG